jgi:hypothetical protein
MWGIGAGLADPVRDHEDLFNDFYDTTAARLHNDGPIVHDCIPVARPHMILSGYRVERYASRGQQLADTHFAAVPERGMVLTDDVFAKPRPLLDAQDTADGTGRGADRSTDNCPERSSRPVTCGRTLFGSPDRALRVRSIGQCCD